MTGNQQENGAEVEDFPESPRLRALRRLVTLLTMSLIIGTVGVTSALMIKLMRPDKAPAAAVSVEPLRLKAGERIEAIGLEGPRAIVAILAPDGSRRVAVVAAPLGGEIAVEAQKQD